jgi:hypothetical protein
MKLSRRRFLLLAAGAVALPTASQVAEAETRHAVTNFRP